MRHQDREGKPFFTDNHEVNDLVRTTLSIEQYQSFNNQENSSNHLFKQYFVYFSDG